MSDADSVVEVLGERLEVDVGGVDVPIELGARILTHVARGHRDRPDPAVVAGVGDVRSVLPEDRWIVVCESHTAAIHFVGNPGQVRGRGPVGECIGLPRLGDIPVLAELAREVAACGAERQHRRARQEVVQRLLLDRVDAEPTGSAIAGEHDLVVGAGTDETEAALSLTESACARAYVALDPAVDEPVPVPGGDGEQVEGHGVLEQPCPQGYPRLSLFRTASCSSALVASALPPCGPGVPARSVNAPPASRTTMSSAPRSHSDTSGSAAMSTAPSASRQ